VEFGFHHFILSPLLIILYSSVKEILSSDVRHIDVEKITFGKKFENYRIKEFYPTNQVEGNGLLTCKMPKRKESSP
jgi:hypothetical protein